MRCDDRARKGERRSPTYERYNGPDGGRGGNSSGSHGGPPVHPDRANQLRNPPPPFHNPQRPMPGSQPFHAGHQQQPPQQQQQGWRPPHQQQQQHNGNFNPHARTDGPSTWRRGDALGAESLLAARAAQREANAAKFNLWAESDSEDEREADRRRQKREAVLAAKRASSSSGAQHHEESSSSDDDGRMLPGFDLDELRKEREAAAKAQAAAGKKGSGSDSDSSASSSDDSDASGRRKKKRSKKSKKKDKKKSKKRSRRSRRSDSDDDSEDDSDSKSRRRSRKRSTSKKRSKKHAKRSDSEEESRSGNSSESGSDASARERKKPRTKRSDSSASGTAAAADAAAAAAAAPVAAAAASIPADSAADVADVDAGDMWEREDGARAVAPHGGDDDSGDEFVGPRPAAAAKAADARSYGNALLPGEGEAIAGFVQAGQRIPRRGEVGLTSTEIEDFEKLGYVMSGSRHKRMNAIRIRKENQVYSAEEKRALAMLNSEEKLQREQRLMNEFRKYVQEKTGEE